MAQMFSWEIIAEYFQKSELVCKAMWCKLLHKESKNSCNNTAVAKQSELSVAKMDTAENSLPQTALSPATVLRTNEEIRIKEEKLEKRRIKQEKNDELEQIKVEKIQLRHMWREHCQSEKEEYYRRMRFSHLWTPEMVSKNMA